MKRTLAIFAFLSALPLAGQGSFEITVTNLTQGQVFTPILAASHEQGFRLFHPGQRASVELEMLAEAGDIGPLMGMLNSTPEVGDTAGSGGPLLPGQTVTVTVDAAWPFDHVSVAAMLVPTNDAFFAVNGVKGPGVLNLPLFGLSNRPVTVYANAWDAGTENNDESCESIPGPPGVCGGEPTNLARSDPADFVRVHSGIYGGGDLDPGLRDWRNPVARVTIRRVR